MPISTSFACMINIVYSTNVPACWFAWEILILVFKFWSFLCICPRTTEILIVMPETRQFWANLKKVKIDFLVLEQTCLSSHFFSSSVNLLSLLFLILHEGYTMNFSREKNKREYSSQHHDFSRQITPAKRSSTYICLESMRMLSCLVGRILWGFNFIVSGLVWFKWAKMFFRYFPVLL